MKAFGRGGDRLRRILDIDVGEDVESELEFHLLMRTRDMEAAGMSPAAAWEKAERDFGDYASIQRECRTIATRRRQTMRRREWFTELGQDLRFGLRQLLRSPGFALVAVLTLALGIGASTSIFSVVNAVLLRSLPFPDPDQLMAVYQVGDEGREENFSHPNFEDLKARTRSFAALAEHASGFAPVMVGEEAVRVPVARVSEEFFPTMGLQAALGRTFLPTEFGTGEPVAIVSHEFWRQYLGASQDLGARTVRVGDQPLTVVGVLPPGVDFPDGAGLWRPQGSTASATRTGHNWQVIGRLRPGVSSEAATRELDAIAKDLKAQYGEDTMMEGAAMRPLHEVIVGGVRPALLVLLGASGLLLLIACANVVNLLLTRLTARRSELAVRVALGAGRGRLMRQFAAESLVLSLGGAALGTLLALAGVRALLAFEPGRLPRVGEISIDEVALLFALGVSVLAAGGMGLIVALRASDGNLRETLTESRGQSGGRTSHRLRSALTIGQVALTLVLLIGAGLLARSFLRLVEVDPGYRTEGALVMDILIPWARDEEEQSSSMRFHHELLTRLSGIPGVEEAGSVNILPLGDGGEGSSGTFLKIRGTEVINDFEDFHRLSKEPGRAGEAVYRVASGGYFRSMGIPVIRGRLFDHRDTPGGGTHAAVISQSLAEAHWPGQDPIGQLIQYGGMDGDMTPFVVVGVVGDVHEQSLDAPPLPTFYSNVRQRPYGVNGPHNIVLFGGDRMTTVATARAILQEMNPGIPVRFRTLEEVFSASLSERRFSLLLLGAFALTALLLAAMGIYGILSYLVAQRTREIGIRLALGAGTGSLLAMVLRGGLFLTAAGVGVGLVIALVTTRLLAGLLYGVATTDAVTFVAVPLLLLGVAALASYIPGRRTTRVDPIIAMRAE